MDKLIIAIDGLTGTGKSLLSRYLSEKLDITYIDSGLFYRAVMFRLIRNNIKLNDDMGICKSAQTMNIVFAEDKVMLDDADVTSHLRALEITNKVTNICKINALRRIINGRLKKYAEDEKGVLIEGKDIGVNVLPDAGYKFYITADMSARTARRYQDFLDLGQKIQRDRIEKELKLRDEFELRKNPVILKRAENAEEVNTTNMILEEQVNYLYRVITNPQI
jgi:cytidylate kinase